GGALDSAGVTGKIVFLAYGPGLNAIASKVLALRPLAVILVAGFPDSIWAKLPGHEASVIVRNPSEESGPAGPAVFAVRTASAGEGCTPGGADSICNGADDDGSGTVAVIELAEAFASARERPKRSLVFMTVSGEERGLWGSAYFADHPTVPLADVIADLNIDMVGRNSKDTVAVIGRERSEEHTSESSH